MKTLLTFLIGASLVANVALWMRAQSRAETSGAPAAHPRPTPPRWVLNDSLWQRAGAGDAAALESIRDSELPPALIRALLRAAIREKFRSREDALYSSAKDARYWTNGYEAALFSPGNRAALMDLRHEQQKLLEQWIPGWREENAADDPNTKFIPADKARQLSAIEQDYGAMISDIRQTLYRGAGNVMLPSDREKLKYLEQEKRSEIAQLLSPSELAEYDVRESDTASSLRYQLNAFNPTEQEFRALVKIQKETVDDLYGRDYGALTPEDQTARNKAQEQADAQIKAALGDQRYADYTRSKDYDYRTFAEIADRLQLPPDRAVEAYKLKTDLEQQFRSMNPTTREERIQALAPLMEVANREFTRILGEKGYAAYKQYGSLPRNVQSILRPPPPPPKPSS